MSGRPRRYRRRSKKSTAKTIFPHHPLELETIIMLLFLRLGFLPSRPTFSPSSLDHSWAITVIVSSLLCSIQPRSQHHPGCHHDRVPILSGGDIICAMFIYPSVCLLSIHLPTHGNISTPDNHRHSNILGPMCPIMRVSCRSCYSVDGRHLQKPRSRNYYDLYCAVCCGFFW